MASSPEPSIVRPSPPEAVIEEAARGFGLFLPCQGLDTWSRAVFMDETSPLYSGTHSDIITARIGWLLTNEKRSRGGSDILGEAGLARPPLAATGWDAAIYRDQLRTWFGSWWEGEPADFKITLYAPWFAEASDLDALAVVKHELLHCRQAIDQFGAPRFTPEWMGEEPIWGLRGHDVEEFAETVEWFGADILDGSVRRLVDAASKQPRAGAAHVSGACGTCARKSG